MRRLTVHSHAREAREVVLRLVVEHPDPKVLDLFARELGSVGLSFAQGTTGLIGGRPKPTPVVRLYTFFIDKAALAAPQARIGIDEPFAVPVPVDGGYVAPLTTAVTNLGAPEGNGGPADFEPLIEVPLLSVAHARSGDKGNVSDIAVFCRKPEYLPYLRDVLTPQRVAAHFAGVAEGPVTRYEAPGLAALNFVLENALGGGGMASRRIDAQGKAYGQRVLEMQVSVPAVWFDAFDTPASQGFKTETGEVGV